MMKGIILKTILLFSFITYTNLFAVREVEDIYIGNRGLSFIERVQGGQ